MSLAARIAAAFVKPAPPATAPSGWAPPVSAAPSLAAPLPLAVLCAPRDARLAGGAAGLALLRATEAAAVAVGEWGVPSARAAAPATPGAARAAAVLREHGLQATVSGRLARVALPDVEPEAARCAGLLLAEAPVPALVVLAGARGEPLDEVVGRALVVMRPDDTELGGLAASELGEAGIAAAAVELPPAPAAAALARAGVCLLEPLRQRFGSALESLR